MAGVSLARTLKRKGPREEVAERYQQSGAEVLRTAVDGAIIIETNGATLRYSGYKSGRKGEIDLTAISAEKELFSTAK